MAKSRTQQAAIAISMKKAGKKPKSLTKAKDGIVVKNKKIVSKSRLAGSNDDGVSFKAKLKTIWDNAGTEENPIATNQRSRSKVTRTDESGKTTTYVTKINSEGETKKRKAIIAVRKTGGMIKSKKK